MDDGDDGGAEADSRDGQIFVVRRQEPDAERMPDACGLVDWRDIRHGRLSLRVQVVVCVEGWLGREGARRGAPSCIDAGAQLIDGGGSSELVAA